MDDRKLNVVRKIAKEKGIDGKIEISNVKGKRFSIETKYGKINFGSYPFKGKGTYALDHHDETIKTAWRARHSKILKNNKVAYKDPTSSEYYSWNLLW